MHVNEIGLAHATDEEILTRAIADEYVIATLDADFHTLLALRGGQRPSVIRFRIQGLKSDRLVPMLRNILRHFKAELSAGAVVSIDERTARCHMLPLK